MNPALAALPPQDSAVIPLRDDFWICVRREAAPDILPFEPRNTALLLTFPLNTDAGPESPMVSLRLIRRGHAVRDQGGQVLVVMELGLLRTILGKDLPTLPETLQRLLREPAEQILRLPSSPEQLITARAIRDCPFSGAVRNIYLKSKALELVASLFSRFHALESGRRGSVPPSADTAPFLRARDILGANLESPPKLRELAARVGMSETRLKRGFKLLFGAAPYEWLHENRLVTARELLLQPGASVSQTAYRVGYVNVSHFIAAFVRRFGTRPGELLRLHRKKNSAPSPISPAGGKAADS